MFRVGFGYDAHRLVENRPLILGGVDVPYVLGLEGHSDADVLTHAIMDALIGATGKGDIGQYFPDTDPAFKDVRSLSLLKEVVARVKRDGYRVNNLDATLVAQSPKIAPYLKPMLENLSNVLEISEEQINLKATTTEGMGFCGRKEGMEAYAIVSLVSSGQL